MGALTFLNVKRICLGLALFIVLALVTGSASSESRVKSEVDFIPLEEIEAGMEGTGKTVVKGSEISEFEVKVIGVIDEPGELNDFIVVRVSGPAIEESGGIAQGMSGSPVYLDDRLAGALSRAATWNRDPSNPLGLITPIEAMLELFQVDEGEAEAMQESGVESQSLSDSLADILEAEKVEFKQKPPSTSQGQLPPKTVHVYPLQTPVVTHGLGKRAFSLLTEGVENLDSDLLFNPGLKLDQTERLIPSSLKEGFSRFDLSFERGTGGSSAQEETMELQPGSPMGVSLTQGDVSIGALGTVTYKDEDTVLGLGHRFLLTGSSEFFLNEARILDTVKSMQAPYKLGTLGQQVGGVSQDRTQGVFGTIGEDNKLLQINLGVSDLDLETTNELRVSAARQSELMGPLTLPIMTEGIARSINRIGPGTAKVTYTIDGEGLPRSLTRTDIFFSTTNVSELPSLQVAILVHILAQNPFQKAELEELNVTTEVTEDINAGQIFYFAADRKTYNPGDSVAYQVKINNYRDETTTKTGMLQLPEDLPEGSYVLAAYGGPRPVEIAPPEELTSLDDYIRYIESIKNYQHLSVELLEPLSEQVVPMSSSGFRYQGIARTDQVFEGRVIYGREALSINVEKEPETNQTDSATVGEEGD
ncbi:MAG: SpoIVB peptidase S55 domain-containing protein [Candidatus Acetothermia bacterium]